MQYIFSILPFLACPLMMGVMMWVMMHGNQGQGNQGQAKTMNSMGQRPTATTATRPDAEDIADRPAPVGRTQDEQLAQLRARLSRLQAQQQAIAGQMAELDGGPEAPPTESPPPAEATAVAVSTTANRRGTEHSPRAAGPRSRSRARRR